MSSWIPIDKFVDDSYAEILSGSILGGLTHPKEAQVLVVLKWHGSALNGTEDSGISLLDTQLHDISGGCKEHRLLEDMNRAPIQFPDGTEFSLTYSS